MSRRGHGRRSAGPARRLPKSINRIRPKTDSIFKMPRNNPFGIGPFVLPKKVKPIAINARGLKPNTAYKVMLDNRPGDDFEDITDTVRCEGTSVKPNPRPKVPIGSGGGKGCYTSVKTDKKGNLNITCKPFGSEENTKRTLTRPPLFSKLWKYWHTRNSNVDRGRDRIKLIQASAVENPTSNARVKRLKKSVTHQSLPSGKKTTRPQKAPEKYLPPSVIAPVVIKKPAKIIKIVEEEVRTDLYQTFYLDASSVDGSDTVDLLDITLYVRSKPKFKANVSGAEGPGINICLIDCESDGTPIINQKYADSVVDLNYYQVKASPLATAGTVFKFDNPLTVRTNRYYAIAVFLEDQGYVLWDNRKGDLTLVDGGKTEERSQGSSKGHKGDVFFYNDENGKKKKSRPQWVPKNDLDLKFDVHCAEYTVDDVTVKLVNKPYEFFNLSSVSGQDWDPGENVYKQQANSVGTVAISAGSTKITGTGTDFTSLTEGQTIVLIDSTDTKIQEVFTVDRSIGGSATILYVHEESEFAISGNYQVTVSGQLEYFDYYFNSIRLENSTVNYDHYTNANSSISNTLIFQVGDTIVGTESGMTAQISSYNELNVSVFRADMNANVPPQFKTTTKYNMSYEDTTPGIYFLSTDDKQFFMNAPNHIQGYAGNILSASQEIDQTDSAMIANQSRSSEIEITYSYTGANTRCYACPTLSLDELEMTTHRWEINNDETNEYLNEGNAKTRHISAELNLGDGSEAEDVRIIMNAWRPRNTDIAVYAKLQNGADGDNFIDKHWTRLATLTGGQSFSDATSPYDYVELEFGLQDYTASSAELDGSFTTVLGSAVITGDASTNVAAVSADDVIRIYSPLFEDNYQLFAVDSVNAVSQQITLSNNVANNNIVGEGFKVAVMEASQAAFKNPDNYDIARYYNSQGEMFDTYNRMAVKIVLLADDRKLVPKVDDYRVIGVTA